MRKAIFIFTLMFTYHFSEAQEVKLIFLTEEAPVYESQSANSPIINRVDTNTEIYGTAIDEKWFMIKLEDGQDAFIMSWDVWPEADLSLIPKRVNPSASTLFRMMRYFRQNQKPEKAEEFAFRIIQQYNEELYPGEGQDCYKLGHKTYIEMLSNGGEKIAYDAFLLGFTSKVIDEVNDQDLVAMAHYHQARFYAQNGQESRALAHLFKIIAHFPTANSTNACMPESSQEAFYMPARAKYLFCELVMQQEDTVSVTQELQNIIASGNEGSTAMAEELLTHLGSNPYAQDEGKWN